MHRPLEGKGIRIPELGTFHAGPGGSTILGNMGAEVIKDPGRYSEEEIEQFRHEGVI